LGLFLDNKIFLNNNKNYPRFTIIINTLLMAMCERNNTSVSCNCLIANTRKNVWGLVRPLFVIQYGISNIEMTSFFYNTTTIWWKKFKIQNTKPC